MLPRASVMPSFLRILVRDLPIIADETSKMSATSLTLKGIMERTQTLNSLSVLADESNFGIICFTDGGQEKGEILSLAEYKTQRALGNIKINAHYSRPPYTEQEKEAIRGWADESDYETIIRKRERPFVLRVIKSPELAKSSPAIEAMKGEIGRLIVNMSEEQLAKALLVIKEVILK